MKKICIYIIFFISVTICGCNSNQKFVYDEMYKYFWIPERCADYLYKIEAFTDGVDAWGFKLTTEEISELEKSDKFKNLSKSDIHNIRCNVFYEGFPDWGELSQNSLFYMYLPYKNEECTDTSFKESCYYIYIWDLDSNIYICVHKYRNLH